MRTYKIYKKLNKSQKKYFKKKLLKPKKARLNLAFDKIFRKKTYSTVTDLAKFLG